MSKFDDILRNSVEGYQAPYNPAAWENVSSQLNSPMDQAIKDSVDKFEAPANPEVWSNISSQLGSSYSALKWIGGTAAAITLILGSVYLLDTDETNNNTNNENIVLNDENLNSDENDIVMVDIISEDETVAENNNVVNNVSDDNSSIDNNDLLLINPNVLDGITEVDPNDGNTNIPEDNDQNDGVVTIGPDLPNYQYPNDSETIVYNAIFTCNNTNACVGSEIIFSADNTNQDALYLWNFGDGTYGSGAVAHHSYRRAGSYTVSLTLKDKKNNKSLKHSEIEITNNPLPAVDFTWEDANSLIPPAVNFINLTDDAQTWVWDIKGLKTSTDNEFDYTFRKKGTYIVSLTAENEFGCQNTIEKPINVEEDYNLYAPTAFTPDGDNENDEFIPKALLIMDNPEFTMTIYDKAGNMVYQTNNANRPWDGRSTSDNTPAPAGAYVWAVELRNENGDLEIYKGQVIIL